MDKKKEKTMKSKAHGGISEVTGSGFRVSHRTPSPTPATPTPSNLGQPDHEITTGDDQVAASSSASDFLDRKPQTTEDYKCIGNLEQDFIVLCQLVGFIEIPKVIARPRPSMSESEKTPKDDSQYLTYGKVGSDQRTDRFSYFTPKIQVLLENEDPKSATEVSIRGWKIEDKMMGVLSKCLPALPKLHKVSWWHVGLTDGTFSSFVEILRNCRTVRVVNLEGNPLPEQSFYKLIADDLPLTQISLRNNQINEHGARLLSQALQSLNMTNKTLTSLNLAFNHIADPGAGHLAEALRFNRSLLSLNLASNWIGDRGACALAQVLGPFSLTDKEVLERRRILMEKEYQKLQKMRIPFIEQLKLRNVSLLNAEANPDAAQPHCPRGKAQSRSPRTAPAAAAPWNPEPQQGTGAGRPQLQLPPNSQKKELKSTVRKSSATSRQTPQPVRGSPKKRYSNPDLKSTQAGPVESIGVINPLLEQGESRHGKIFLPGNRVLLNLNLLGNKITEEGLKGFLKAMETQIHESKQSPGNSSPTGLLRLSINRNSFSPYSSVFLRLQKVMLSRDPIHKASAQRFIW